MITLILSTSVAATGPATFMRSTRPLLLSSINTTFYGSLHDHWNLSSAITLPLDTRRWNFSLIPVVHNSDIAKYFISQKLCGEISVGFAPTLEVLVVWKVCYISAQGIKFIFNYYHLKVSGGQLHLLANWSNIV